MCVFGRPENVAYIYGENQGAQGEGLHWRLISGLLEITHVVPEYAIFVEDFRGPGAPGWRRSGGTGRARFSDRSIAERVLNLFSTAVRHPLAHSGASTEVPRRIFPGLRPFRRGSWM